MHHPNSRSVADRPSVSCAGWAVRWALGAVAVAATFYLLAFGVAVLLGVPPTQRGHGFWRPEKFVYGLLPVFATPAILAITAPALGPTICSKTKRLADFVWGRRLCGTTRHYRVPEAPRAAGRKNPLGLAERMWLSPADARAVIMCAAGCSRDPKRAGADALHLPLSPPPV